MQELDKSYNPKEVESKWYKFWEKHGFFKANAPTYKPPFCIIMPPPNVTGKLHMGHALVSTLQDVLIRFKRMKGFEALWVPGTDHAGISTQTIVEKHLYRTLHKKRVDFTREEFINEIWKWKDEHESNILNQLKKLGCSCDWSRLSFTMDSKSSHAVKVMFKKMFDEGIIVKDNYLVNWDPVSQTALSDDEVEHEEVDSYLWYFKYPLAHKNRFITIATTRPETLLGDTAVAVNPKDLRYQALIGEKILLPLSNREIPIIADPSIDLEFGTGAVKITPAHDPNDYEIALRHNLEMINIMTPDGKINDNGGEFRNLSMKEARNQVVLKMTNLGFLEKAIPHTLRVGKSYRSKAVIEPYLSKQWFVKMSLFKQRLIDLVKEKKVIIEPAHFEKIYFHWIENLRDWCISRQILWGHQIPVWYHVDDPEKMICYSGDDLPLEVKKEPLKWKQDPDVLDTWFSSALWPFSTLGWPEKTPYLKTFYPTSILITGHDILFFWVARMIMMGDYALHEVPFHQTFLHGLIFGKSYWREDKDGSITYVDAEEKKEFDLGKPIPKGVLFKWEKMSKSKGNVIDPIEIIDEYGTDAMRLALCASATHAKQIDLDRRRFDDYKNFANKVWNGARFVFLNFEDLSYSKELNYDLFTLEDKWILSLLNKTIGKMNEDLEKHHFDKAALCAYDFFWKEFCSYYLELCKPLLFRKIDNEPLRENKQKILVVVLSHVIALLHPIAPFITEQIFSHLKEKFGKVKPHTPDIYTEKTMGILHSEALIIAPYPEIISEKHIDAEIEKNFSFVESIIYAIRNIRAEMQIPLGEKTDIYLMGTKHDPHFILAKENQSAIFALTQTKDIFFVESIDLPHRFGASSYVEGVKIFIPLPAHLKEKEISRLEKEDKKLLEQCTSLELKLNLPDFKEKAPTEVVQKMMEQLNDIKKKLYDIKQKLIQITEK